MQRLIPRLLVAAISIGAIITLALLWPAQLGGATSYVTTHGSSMEPGFHQGDLALVRTARTYRVGDIVAYHSDLLNTVVLHRIIEISDGHYSFKGDNNSWRDADQPTRSQLIGRLWIHGPHAGTLLTRWKISIVFGIAALLAFRGTGRIGNRRRRRPERIPMTVRSSNRLSARQLRTAAIALGCCAGIVTALAALALTQPAEATASTKFPYRQETTFSYGAPGPDSVYQAGGIAAGEPVFVRLTNVVDIAATYDFAANATTKAKVTIGLRAELSDASGWHRRFVITPPTTFDGTHAATHGPLNITALEDAVADLRAATGTATTTYAVRVFADVNTTAAIDGRPLSATFTPVIEFQLDPLRLTPLATDPQRSPFVQSTTQALEITTARANRLEIVGLGVDVRAIRFPALCSGALAAIGALVCVQATRRRLPDAAARTALRLGSRLVSVRASELRDGLSVLDVATIDGLARLADEHGRLILHEGTGEQDAYYFHVGRTIYRCRIPNQRAVTAPA